MEGRSKRTRRPTRKVQEMEALEEDIEEHEAEEPTVAVRPKAKRGRKAASTPGAQGQREAPLQEADGPTVGNAAYTASAVKTETAPAAAPGVVAAAPSRGRSRAVKAESGKPTAAAQPQAVVKPELEDVMLPPGDAAVGAEAEPSEALEGYESDDQLYSDSDEDMAGEEAVGEGEDIGATDDEMTDIFGQPKSNRICASYAKQEYKVNDKDLRPLKYEARRNPHYRSAAPMKLYLRREVIRLARQVRARKKAWKESKGERAEQAALAHKEKAKEAAAQARAAVDAFKPLRVDAADSGLHGAWPLIVRHLTDDFEPNKDGAVSQYATTSVMLRRLLNLGNTCKEMHRLVLDVGLPTLAAKVQPRFWEGVGVASEVGQHGEKRLPHFWDTLITAPATLKLPELKGACKLLREKQSGTKDELIVRLYKRLSINGPKHAPAALLFPLMEEKAMSGSTLAYTLPASHSQADSLLTQPAAREYIESRGVTMYATVSLFEYRAHLSEVVRLADEQAYRNYAGEKRPRTRDSSMIHIFRAADGSFFAL